MNNLMNSIWSDTKIVFPMYCFRKMLKTKTTFKQFQEIIDDFKNTRNKYLGYNLGNNFAYLENKGNLFIFLISGLSTKEFILWDDHSRFLTSIPVNYEDVPTLEFCEHIEKVTDEYDKGSIHCSCCNKLIKKTEVAGTLLAGMYCVDCWESKYKEMAANFNYD